MDERQELAAGVAVTRSREADFATDQAAASGTPVAHSHAERLHREAALWQRRADRRSRAELHDESAAIHHQLATTLLIASAEPGDPDGDLGDGPE